MKLNYPFRPVPAASLALASLLALAACGSDPESDEGAAGDTATDVADASTHAGATDEQAADGSAEPIDVSVAALPIVPTAGLQYGIDSGIFEEHGINLTLDTGTGSETMVAAAYTGQVDFVTLNSVSTMIALDAGLPLLVTSGFTHAWDDPAGEDISGILVKADSDIASARDLAGRSVAVNTIQSAGTISIREAVRADGGDPDAVEFVEIRYPDMMGALERDQVDAIWEVEPFITIAQSTGAKVVSWNFLESSPGVATQVVVTAQDQDPEKVNRFTEALTAVLDAAASDEEGVRESLVNLIDMDPAMADNVRLERFSTDIDVEAVGVFAGLALSDGLVENEVDMTAFPAVPR